MNLPIPPEPREKLRGVEGETPNWIRGRLLSWDSITSYLWHTWKKELEKYGVTWNDFQSFLANDFELNSLLIDWVQQKISWEECVSSIKQKLCKVLEQRKQRGKEITTV
jgi:hypothetical protein